MQLTSVLVAAATLLAPVFSHAIIPMGRRETGLDVELASVGATKVKVSVTNSADHEINVLKVNSFFDKSPVQKVNVRNTGMYRSSFYFCSSANQPVDCDKGFFPFIDCQKLPFMGINRAYSLNDLTKEDFQPIAPGTTVDAEFDIAETFDLEAGEFKISAEGSLPFSTPDCTGIAGVIPYKSNEITIKVSEPSSASTVASIQRRGILDADTCTAEQKTIVNTAVKRAASVSSAAADAALNGDARLFEYYFRTTDTATRKEVAARFKAIANEAASGNKGNVTFDCGHGMEQSECGKGALAYAVSGVNLIVNCPGWYVMTDKTDDCGGKDQALAMIHELSHLSDVYSPGTGDMAYGYDAIINLSKEDAVLNADTYLYYASGEFSHTHPFKPSHQCTRLTNCFFQPSSKTASPATARAPFSPTG